MSKREALAKGTDLAAFSLGTLQSMLVDLDARGGTSQSEGFAYLSSLIRLIEDGSINEEDIIEAPVGETVVLTDAEITWHIRTGFTNRNRGEGKSRLSHLKS